MIDPETNRKLVQDQWDAFNRGDMAAAAEFFAEDTCNHGRPVGRAGVRFAGRVEGAVAVVLDPDVASVFGSSDTVNTLLRSVIAAMPERGKKRAKAG